MKMMKMRKTVKAVKRMGKWKGMLLKEKEKEKLRYFNNQSQKM